MNCIRNVRNIQFYSPLSVHCKRSCLRTPINMGFKIIMLLVCLIRVRSENSLSLLKSELLQMTLLMCTVYLFVKFFQGNGSKFQLVFLAAKILLLTYYVYERFNRQCNFKKIRSGV